MGDNDFEYALKGAYSLQGFTYDFMMWAVVACFDGDYELTFLCNGWEL